MGIKWKNRVKKWMAEALLGALLIIPGAVSPGELPQSSNNGTELRIEAVTGENQPAAGLAEGELPGGGGDGGIMPCGDLEEEKVACDDGQ